MPKLTLRGRLVLWLGCVVTGLLVSFALFFYARLGEVLNANLDELLQTRAAVIAAGLTPDGRIPGGMLGREGNGHRRGHWDRRGPETERNGGDVEREQEGDWRDESPPPSDFRGDGERGPWNRRRPLEPLARVLQRGHADHGECCIVITDRDRQVIESPRGLPAGSLDRFPLPVERPVYFTVPGRDGGLDRFIAYPFATEEGDYLLYVGESTATVERLRGRIALWLLVALPLTALLIIGGVALITRRGLSPVTGLARAAAAMDGSDLTRRLAVPDTRDEVAALAQSFNGLLDRIADAMGRLRQFTADASHELRTPVAGLKTRLQVARRRERTPDEYRELLATLETDLRGVEHLLDELLTLARLDAGREQLNGSIVALAPLAAAVAAEPGFAGLRLSVTVPDGLTVRGNEVLLRQLIRNLLENAGKHAGPAAAVCVTAAIRGRDLVLEVVDDGPGVPAAALPHLFDRFYKADEAHSDRAGVGLGLSIVAGIAALHGGSVRAENNLPHGLRVVLTLPIAL